LPSVRMRPYAPAAALPVITFPFFASICKVRDTGEIKMAFNGL